MTATDFSTSAVATSAPAFVHGGVCAVIIFHNASPDTLHNAVAAIAPQVDTLLLYDNWNPQLCELDAAALPAHARWIGQGHNDGLGRAINRAAEVARASGHRWLLLLDQDSVPAPDMVATLLDAAGQLRTQGPLAALGPRQRDARSGQQAPFIRVGFPLNRKLSSNEGLATACDFLITSGSLIPLDALAKVGGMDERLFIDNVDLEWCFRARHAGYRLYGVHRADMLHSIGDDLRASRVKRRGVFIHAPIRYYYIMRNRVLLYWRPATPGVWIAQDLPRLLLKFTGTALFVAPRTRNLRMMLSGLWHGLAGHSGAHPSSQRAACGPAGANAKPPGQLR